jgi:hypothetical protein
MRNHVGKHILKGHMSENPNRCRFCGGLECTVGLQHFYWLQGYGDSKRFNVVSNWDYFWDFSKTKNISNSNPCQNRPTECSECETLEWSYNMKEHYRISHPEIQTCPHEISQELI